MLVGCDDLSRNGFNMEAAQAEDVFVERIISVPNAFSWKDTFSAVPNVYIDAVMTGEIKPRIEPPLLLQYGDIYIALSMGWKIALAKLTNVESIQAMVICYH